MCRAQIWLVSLRKYPNISRLSIDLSLSESNSATDSGNNSATPSRPKPPDDPSQNYQATSECIYYNISAICRGPILLVALSRVSPLPSPYRFYSFGWYNINQNTRGLSAASRRSNCGPYRSCSQPFGRRYRSQLGNWSCNSRTRFRSRFNCQLNHPPYQKRSKTQCTMSMHNRGEQVLLRHRTYKSNTTVQ